MDACLWSTVLKITTEQWRRKRLTQNLQLIHHKMYEDRILSFFFRVIYTDTAHLTCHLKQKTLRGQNLTFEMYSIFLECKEADEHDIKHNCILEVHFIAPHTWNQKNLRAASITVLPKKRGHSLTKLALFIQFQPTILSLWNTLTPSGILKWLTKRFRGWCCQVRLYGDNLT